MPNLSSWNRRGSFERLQSSLSFRLGPISEFIVSHWPMPRRLPIKETRDLTLLSMCGRRHLSMLQECLLSIYKTWSKIPHLKIVSDGSMSKEEIYGALSWWPCSYETFDWKEIAESERYKSQRYECISAFAQKSVVGRKLMSILYFGSQEPTLYCDADILWFDGLPGMSLIKAKDVQLALMEDYQPSYDESLSSDDTLGSLPYLNSGLVYINEDLLEFPWFRDFVKQATVSSNHFTEQTILAMSAHEVSSFSWDPDKIACSVYKRDSLSPTFLGETWAARHYVGGVRHLFWRDAIALRIKYMMP